MQKEKLDVIRNVERNTKSCFDIEMLPKHKSIQRFTGRNTRKTDTERRKQVHERPTECKQTNEEKTGKEETVAVTTCASRS